MSQTEALSQVMKKRSEDLLDGPISKLTLLIRDKQQLRKTYSEQWNLLRHELTKVRDEHTHTSSGDLISTQEILITMHFLESLLLWRQMYVPKLCYLSYKEYLDQHK